MRGEERTGGEGERSEEGEKQNKKANKYPIRCRVLKLCEEDMNLLIWLLDNLAFTDIPYQWCLTHPLGASLMYPQINPQLVQSTSIKMRKR